MTYSGSKRISSILARRKISHFRTFTIPEQCKHGLLHLLLAGATVAHDRGFDLSGVVLRNSQSSLGGGKKDDTTSFT
jgi:hypothetical protein